MARRETLMRELACSCGTSGKATWSENENPAHANWQIGAEIPAVSGPFSPIDEATGEDARFRCHECGEIADLGKATLVRD